MNANQYFQILGARASARFNVNERVDSGSKQVIPELKRRKRGAPSGVHERGFSLTELAVVLCLLTLVMVLVLPALASGRNSNRDMQCVDNQKRLAAGWLMYATENNDRVMSNPNGSPPWMPGTLSWILSSVTTNSSYLTDPAQTGMAQYVRDARVYKCPADIYKPASWAVPRVRSVSLNGAIAGQGGAGPAVRGTNPGGRRYYGSGASSAGSPVKTMSDLNSPGPARTFLILDEHPDSLSDSAFMLDPGPPVNQERWRDLPASYHDDNACGISYADGHAEIHKWLEPYRPAGINSGNSKRATFYPVVFNAWWLSGSSAPWASGYMVASKDFEWMQDGMPYRLY